MSSSPVLARFAATLGKPEYEETTPSGLRPFQFLRAVTINELPNNGPIVYRLSATTFLGLKNLMTFSPG